MHSLPATMQATLAALVLTAAAYDLRFRRIPNWLAATGLVLGLLLNSYLFRGPGLRASCLGMALALAVYFPLFALRAMGAGDVKLMLAVGAFSGPGNWLSIFIITSILGGVLAVFLLLYRGQWERTLRNVLTVFGEVLHLRPPYRRNPELDVANPRAVRLPHAVSIAGGTLLFLALDYVKNG